jgi:biopolymer transport protein ExbB/TolQ
MKRKRMLLIVGMVVGGLLTLAPVLGFAGTVLGMMRAFNTLGSSGAGDPKALSQDISVVLVSTATGVILLPVGIALFTTSLIFFLRQRRNAPPPPPTHQA